MMLRRAYLLLVFALGCLVLTAAASAAATREYFIAAEGVVWDYAPAGTDVTHHAPLPPEVDGHTKWHKTRFIEYTNAEFHTRTVHPAWLGIMGPIIRAEVGDTIIVHFKNKGDRPYSMHPHGLRYTKDDEGAYYHPAGRGARVRPGESYTYTWIADERSAPGPRDASSTVWWYHSHVDEPEDINAGLLGPIIVTAQGKARQDGSPQDVQREFVTLFMIFIEAEQGQSDKQGGVEMMSINGYLFGNLTGLDIHQGETVRWYVLGMGDERDLHTAHWHGETVEWNGRRTDVIELLPASMVTVNMAAENVGTWMYHCHVAEHMKGGMHTTFTIHE
jgi:FtsP/CotA-like multicopper oxidase with cupredoxin domain